MKHVCEKSLILPVLLLSACGQVTGSDSGSAGTTLVNFILGQPSTTASTANNGGIGDKTLSGPSFVHSNGTSLFAADTTNNRILMWNTIPSTTQTAANIVIGQANMTGSSSGTSATTLRGPKSVFVSGTKMYAADTTNNRVLIWNSIPTSNQPSASVVAGQANMTSSSTATTATGMNAPSSVFTDGTKLHVADTGNHRVIIFNTIPTSDGASASVAVGQPNLTSGSSGTSAVLMKSPGGVFSDGTKLYVADTGNHRVLIFNTVPTSNGATANVVLGQSSMTAGSANAGGTASAMTLSSPSSVFVIDSKLYVADSGNNRVLVWNTIPTANQTPADQVFGQTSMTGSTANGGSISGSTVSNPLHAFVSGTTLFVSDAANNRIVGYSPAP